MPAGEGRDALLREATNELTYYRTIRDCARVGRRLLLGDRSDAAADLDRMRARVEATDFNAVDASELRATSPRSRPSTGCGGANGCRSTPAGSASSTRSASGCGATTTRSRSSRS
ncbi:hypothetical protein G7085_13295 [Tessaracoccus sp. HDW20]|uniref:hypothetical protein n=1 Tax=Tessaracoccus coleopterorum TaxID=2714950 RepID=UPI0018D39EA6|nr:hypothetical protein [Tessaracoccus coleopterorum]NHB85281.1 hypothetical protein [Tessaracoccus coleopterorum]